MQRRISSRIEEMANMGEGRPTGRQNDNLSLTVDLAGYDHATAMTSAAVVMNAPAPSAMINQSN